MPTTPTLMSHDLLLKDYAGTPVTLGLIIEKDKTGRPLFRRQPSDSLSQQQFQEFSAAMFPPQYQGFITQNTWHGGFGKQTLTGRGGDNRYMQTHGVDKSIKGLSYPSPVPASTTNTTPTYAPAASGTNLGFETASLSGWTNSPGTGVSIADSTASPRTGTHHARWTYNGANNTEAKLSQLLTTVDTSLFLGTTLTITAYAKYTTEAPDSPIIKLYADSGLTLLIASQAMTVGNGSYSLTTLTHVFTDGWPVVYLVVSMKNNATGTGGGTADVDDITVTLTGSTSVATTVGTPVKQLDFNSVHYMVSDTGVWKISAANWTRVSNSPTGITDAFVSANGSYLVLCRGSSLSYWLMNTSEVFLKTSSESAGSKLNLGGVSNALNYGVLNTQTAYKIGTLTTSTVTTTYTIGDTGASFTKFVDHLSVPFFIKGNSGYYINSSGTVIEIAHELRSMANTNTGKNSISWRGNGAQSLYMPAGAGASLLVYDDGNVDPIGPDIIAERLADFTGQIVGSASDDQWLYICVDNSTKIEILKGRFETIDGVTDFRLHTVVEDTNALVATITYAAITSIGTKRLYYGGTGLPRYIPLSTQYGNPLGDTGLTFNTAVTDESPWYDLNLPRISKSYLNFTIDSTGLTSVITITVEYQLWESQGTWTELGGSGNGIFNTSPTQTKTFAINISGRKIRFRFTYTTNNTATAYGMYEYTCRLALAPKRLNIYTATVRVGNNNMTKKGEKDTEQIYTKVAPQLHTWKDTQPLLITYPDGQMDASDGSHDGATEEVKFLEGYPRETPITQGEYAPVRKDPESLFELALVSIDRSVN